MPLLILFFLASFAEGTVKYITHSLPDTYYQKIRPFIPYFTLMLGVVFACYFKLDILRFFGLTTDGGWLSYLITGVIIGRGSNYLNDLLTKIKSEARASVLEIEEKTGVDKSEVSV